MMTLSAAWIVHAQEAAPWREVPALDGPAASAPEGFRRDTPRATLRHFLDAVEEGLHGRAAAALKLPPSPTAEPEELARMLAAVIDRRLWLSAGDLPDRADGIAESALSDPAAQPAPISSLRLGELPLGRWPVTIRLRRYKPADGDPVWLFDPSTVEATPALYARYGPGWLESRAPDYWREPAFWGLKRWEVLALPSLAAAATLLAWLASALLGLLARRLSGGAAAAVASAQTPAALLVAGLSASAAVERYAGFSAPVTTVLSPVLTGLLTLALLITMLRLIDAGLERVTHRWIGDIDDTFSRDRRRTFTTIYAVRRLVTLIAVLAGVGMVMFELDAFANIGVSLLASAGVAAVVLGVAAQTVLGNILASLQIAIAKPIRIGDSVEYEGQWSYVEAIFHTFVRLRTWDDRRLIVPVQYFISRPFQNWSMIEAKMTQTFWLTLDHDADTGAVREAFERIARDDPDVLAGETLKMLVLGHGAEGVRCRFYVTAADPTKAWNMHGRVQEALIAWVRENRPDWWPRERVRDVSGNGAQTSGDGVRATAAE
jgi:small-conductance mechanosensitive channel